MLSDIIFFDNDIIVDDNIVTKDILGGKGYGLVKMCNLGISVPPGFIISTRHCIEYYRCGYLSKEIKDEIIKNISLLEKKMNKKFGDNKDFPLLVSVRSGAKFSMPGMMDTILNLGTNDNNFPIIQNYTNGKFALEIYSRLIKMFGNVIHGIEMYNFDLVLNEINLENSSCSNVEEIDVSFSDVINRYKDIIKLKANISFTQDPYEQLFLAIEAVFKSWMNERAVLYRKIHDISDDIGTAVTVQAMVFGNLNDNSGTGVVFSRNPSNGENKIYGEYLINAQGEDVVAGIRTPLQIKKEKTNEIKNDFSMEEIMPDIFQELLINVRKLENYYKDVQDIEFTIENGKLWILQTRNAKRTINAAIKIGYDFVHEGIITKKQAIDMIDVKSLDKILHKTIDENFVKTILATGLPASPGTGIGKIVFSSNDVEKFYEKGEEVILVTKETSPDDFMGMYLSKGILTAFGGMTSHAAIVARGIGKPCVCGCEMLDIDQEKETLRIGEYIFHKGDIITIDGSSGNVILGEVPTKEPELSSEFKEIMNWVDEMRPIKVRVNAETVLDCETGIKFGADGIGLARSEHMFFQEDRLLLLRQIIFSETKEQRLLYIKKLLPYQEDDFLKIFSIMNGLPVNVRFLDPPLHEFLMYEDDEIEKFSRITNNNSKNIRKIINSLKEANPMLGHRGSRLGITFPELYEMQAEAIFKAYIKLKEVKKDIQLEIMLPIIMSEDEFDILQKKILIIKENIENQYNQKIKCSIGTMIEVPRACIIADKLASRADYFSFGTNDLTQTILGISRDDSVKFIKDYINSGIFKHDPFITLDFGVQEMIKIAISNAKKVKDDIKFGICGEHGGDPKSIAFAVENKINYVSCSPYRIFVAKIASVQALK